MLGLSPSLLGGGTLGNPPHNMWTHQRPPGPGHSLAYHNPQEKSDKPEDAKFYWISNTNFLLSHPNSNWTRVGIDNCRSQLKLDAVRILIPSNEFSSLQFWSKQSAFAALGLCSRKLVIGAQCTFFLMKGFSKGLFRKNMKRRDFRRDCSGKTDNDGIF